MKRKLIQTIINGNREVKIVWDSEWQQYQCRLYVENKFYQPATYFTDDLSDAIDSAKAMAKPLREKKETRA